MKQINLLLAAMLYMLAVSNSAISQIAIPNPVCYGNPINLICNLYGCEVPGATYIWNNSSGSWTSNQANPVILPGNPGYSTDRFYLQVLFSPPPGGFSGGSVLVTVNPAPVPTITGPVSVCQNSMGNVYATQSGMTGYNWTVSSGGTITAGAGTNAITVTWNIAGVRTVTVNYTNAAGCTAVSPIVYNVTVNPLLPVSVSVAPSANPVLPGTSVTFTATPVNGGSTPVYQWKKNGTNVAGATNSTYSFIPVNGNTVACMLTSNVPCPAGNPATSNTVTMIVQPAMTLTFNVVPDCAYGLIAAIAGGGTPPYSYVWNNGAVTPEIHDLISGIYTVTVTDVYTWSMSGSASLENLDCDFGDAPDDLYKTYRLSDGARHKISELRLGLFIDPELNGQPTVNADGDDLNGAVPDDEDGITEQNGTSFTHVHPGLNLLWVTAHNFLPSGQTAYLQGWIDKINGNGWITANQILTSVPVLAGPYYKHVIFNVQPQSTPINTYARFRLSTVNNLSTKGLAPDGEVEDDIVYIDTNQVFTLDYGDAPDAENDQGYPTLLVHDGARHFGDCHVRLGGTPDAENDGQPTKYADGDDGDENGVVFPPSFSAANNLITIYPHNYLSSGNVYLNGWIDFDKNETWGNSPNEHFIDNYQIPYAGTACCYDPNYQGWPLNIPVPFPAGANGCYYLRFRISDTPGLGPTQPASDPITIGEVEDYHVCIDCPPACEIFDDGTSNFMMHNHDGSTVSNTNGTYELSVQPPGSGGYAGDMGLEVTDLSGSTWVYNNTTDYSGNYYLCPDNCLCWDINMDVNDQSYYPSIFLFRGFDPTAPIDATNPQYFARFTSNSLTGLDVWAHTCARIQPSSGNDPPVSPAGTWTWNNYPGKGGTGIQPPWNSFISNIEGIMFRVDVTPWGGTEIFTLDSICLGPCVTDTVTLTVNSFPSPNVIIPAAPPDIYGAGSGTTSFTRDYIKGTFVYLTAPQTVTCGTDAYCFSHWIINNMNFITDYTNPVKVRMNADKAYTAIYCKKDKVIQVKATVGILGLPLTDVNIAYSPSGANGLIINKPTPLTPYTGNYYYPTCGLAPVMFQLTAPLYHGNYKFLTWHVTYTDCFGNGHSMVPTGNNVITYPLDQDYECIAIYEDCCAAIITNASGPNCCDGSIDFTFNCGTSPLNYIWSNTVTSEDISGLCPGTYCVTVTDANLVETICCWTIGSNKSTCQSNYLQNTTLTNGMDVCYDAFQTIYVAGNGTNFIVQSGGTATMVAGVRISYLPGTKVYPGGHMHGYITSDGQYCGNKNNNGDAISEEIGTNSLSTWNMSENQIFKVYPNPTTGNFTLELNYDHSDQIANVEIFSMRGEKIMKVELKGERKHEFSLSDKQNGVYFIRVIAGKHAGTGKIIKQ